MKQTNSFPETGELSEAAAQLAALEAAKSAAESSAAEFKDKYLREMADKENFRKRMNREVANAKEFAVQAFAKDLLEVSNETCIHHASCLNLASCSIVVAL